MNMDKETEQTLNYLPLGQSDPFDNDNEGTIGDFLGRYCNNPQEISPLTLQSFSLNSQISENFPISGGIRFPPYPGQFGSDREFGSQPTTQESNKSSLLDPDSVSDRVHTTKSNSRKRKSIPSGNGKESPASSSLTASNSKVLIHYLSCSISKMYTLGNCSHMCKKVCVLWRLFIYRPFSVCTRFFSCVWFWIYD